jgi:hypothetical protein
MVINLIPRSGPNAAMAFNAASVAVRERRAIWVVDRLGIKVGWKVL